MINRIDPVPNELAVRKLGTDSVQIGLADSVKAILNRPEVVLPEPTDLSSVLARIAALEGAIQQVPPGLIAMWSGLLVNIPLGWVLCDGNNGTPDLRDKFIKGSAAGIDPGVTGGSSTHTHDDHSYTPAGTVSAPTFTGTPAATSSDSGGTPAGTVSQPTFTGDALGTHSHGVGTYANTAISAGTPAGTIAWPAGVPTAANESAHTHSVTSNVSVNDHAAHTHSVTSNVSVDTHASHTHTFTASATAATPDLVTSNTAAAGVAPSGTTAGPSAALTHVTNNPAVTSGNPSATLSHTTNNPAVTSGAGSAHTHVLSWPAGVPTFAGAALGTHNHVFSGSSEAISGGTPSGTVSQPTFTGAALAAHSHNYTPAGTNSTPTFTGTPALLSHSVANNEPVYFSLAFIMKL